MKEIMKLGAILLVICMVSASLLGLTNELTVDKILAQRELANQIARQAVLSDATDFKAIDEAELAKITAANDKVKEVFIGLDGEEVVGYVVKTTPTGFGGAVEVTTGIGADGTVKGVRMGNHAETPGLGANAALPVFYEQYNGLSALENVGVNKQTPSGNEIQAISGATITSVTITNGVNYSIEVVTELNK